jgi:hypothetical protein
MLLLMRVHLRLGQMACIIDAAAHPLSLQHVVCALMMIDMTDMEWMCHTACSCQLGSSEHTRVGDGGGGTS